MKGRDVLRMKGILIKAERACITKADLRRTRETLLHVAVLHDGLLSPAFSSCIMTDILKA